MPLVPLDDSGAPASPSDASIKVKGGKLVPLGGAVSPGAPELHRGPSPLMRLGEEAVRAGGYYGGGALGAAAGAAPAIAEGSTIVGIPAAAATEYAATKGGEAAGGTLSDLLIAEFNKYLYGTPTDISGSSLAKDYAANLAGSVAAGPIQKGLGAVGRAAIGKGPIQEAATGAAEKVAKEAGVAGSEEMATKAAESKVAMDEAHQAAESKASQATAEARAQLTAPEGAKSVVPGARQEAMQAAVGRTPEATTRAQTLPPEVGMTEQGPYAAAGPGTVARRAQFYGAVFGPKNRAASALGEKFDKMFAPYADVEVDAKGIGGAAAEEETWAQQNGQTFSRGTQQILDDAKDLASPKGTVSPQSLGIKPKDWKRLSPSEREMIQKGAGKLSPSVEKNRPAGLMGVERNRMTTQGFPYVSPKGTQQPTIPTVGQWLGLRSRIGEQLASAEGPDKAALVNLRDSIDDTLTETGVPGAKGLRAQYRSFKTDFGKDFYRAVGSAKDPIQAGDALFTQPQRFLQLASGATADEKATLRDTFGDWFNATEGKKMAPEMAPSLKALGYSGPLADPKGWLYESKAVPKLGELFANSPAARQKYSAAIQSASQDARTTAANDIVKAATDHAKSLGPAGQRMLQAINAAKTPEEKAAIALKQFTGLTPEQAAQELTGAQEQAGAQTVQKFKAKDVGLFAYMKRRAGYMAIAAGPMAMMGHGFMLAGALVTAPLVAIHEGLTAAYLYSLRDPQRALLFYRAIANPGAPSSLQTISKMVVEAGIADAASQGIKAGVKGTTGADLSLEKAPPAPKSPGPMSQAIERKKAEMIAGERGANSPARIDRIQKVSSDVASGKTPDIQRDLRDGRLSIADARKMVQGDKADLTSMFDGVPLPDAVTILARATPQEKELAWPAMAQKFQNEGSKLKPEQRNAIMAQLKRVMQPEQAEETVG